LPIIAQLRRKDGQPRRWRFRLRTLLVVVLAVGLGLGWLAYQLQNETEQVGLVVEMSQYAIYASQYEPNSVGRMLELLPVSVQKALVPRRLRWTIFYSPSKIQFKTPVPASPAPRSSTVPTRARLARP
jgi:hypothetical protein